MGIGAGGACACCNRAAAACICIILYSIKQEPALFLRKQTAILLPLLTWCSASDTRKTDLSAVCESNQLVKSFFFFFSICHLFLLALGSCGHSPILLRVFSARCLVHWRLLRHITAAHSFANPSAVVSWPSRDAACEWHHLDHTHGRRSKSASLHPLFGIR